MKKKLLAMLMTSCIMAGTMSSVAMAGNTRDTNIALTVPMDTYVSTDGRQKTDTSSTYVYLTQVPQAGYIRCQVQGEREYNNSGMLIWYNETVGTNNVNLTTGEWFIRQNVYEHGGRNARLSFSLYAGNPGRVIGRWSPDSVGSGRYAN